MNCCQCQGIEELFNPKFVAKELSRYQSKGPAKTTQMLIEAMQEGGVEGLSLLDIGGGIGAVQHGLIHAGAESATDVDASSAYIQAAREEAQRQGLSDRVTFYLGNFVELAADIPPADIVTLDRVICCYPEMEKMVDLSAARARKLYGLVYPRDTWWVRIGLAIENFIFKLQRNPFRSFVHPTKSVEDILSNHGLMRRSYRRTLLWQVVVYTR
jgi:magnesium-protoporphyrin O-methyltransferase